MMGRIAPVVALLIVNCFIGQVCSAEYLGKLIGKLSELHHAVSGEVYAVDGRTLYIKDFTYDGQGPAAYFYASSGKSANGAGFRLRDENGSGEVIRRYRKEGVTLTLPDGKTLRDIKIFYVWCEEFDVNFGDVKIPRTLDFPRPLKIEALKGVHGISSDNIVVVDAQTLLIPNLSYDGEAPDAKFWVGRGPKPSPQGIRVPDENGKEIPLRRYDRKTVVLTLPGDLTVFDIGHFGIWCEAFTVDFGHVQIPQGMNVPPSLKMLGVSPQKRRILQDYPQQQQQQSKLNCEVLNDNLAFEVRWAVAGESIVLQLVAKLDDREYVSFGISGEDDKSVMIGGDVVVAWVDKETLKGYAEDYYLNDKSQCSGPTGSCPDNRLSEKDNSNNIRLLNAAMVNGYSIVTYQRPLKASDKFDRSIHTNRSQAIIWAIGPLNQRNEVSFHSQYLKTDKFIDFGRPAKWNCPMPESDQTPMRAAVSVENRQKIIEEAEPAVEVEEEPATQAPRRNSNRRRGGNRGNQQQVDNEKSATKSRPQTRNAQRGSVNTQKAVPTPKPVSKSKAWEIPPIECDEPDDGVFYAQMGPTGGKHGYPAITGHVGWGISWYINGLLIPEINVVRGKTYTFVVEGGEDPEIPAKYHPFYITDDSVGGYEHKTEEEKKNVTIFAGARKRKDGKYVPNATGRLCNWTPQGEKDADDFDSFGAYQRILKLICDSGEPGFIQWTPDRNTPDTVYYQCFTHRYLGWKINVLDTCDRETAASETKSISVPAPSDIKDQYNTDLENSPSQRIETRVKPNDIHFQENKEDKTSLKTFSELSTKLSKNPDHHGKQEQPIQMILIKSQQGFFDPHNSGSGKYQNPFTFENPYKRLSDFRPSPIMDHTKVTQTLTSTTIKPQNSVNDIILSPPALPSNTKIIRRPPPRPYIQNLPPRPHYVPLRHALIPVSIKKPIYRPRPPMFSNIKNMFMTAVSQMKRLPTLPLPQLPPKPQIIPTETPKIMPETQPEIKNIEISPQQPSTEKDPELQTSSQLLSISEVAPNMLPARNTGFKPSSVVIEKGFKPIISQEVKERLSEEPELSYESQIGVINQRHYEPVFIPEKYKFRKAPYPKKNVMKIIYKRPRSLDPTDMEPIAEAAERVDTYLTYLPPLTQTQKPVDIVRQPSNIDFESPEIDLESPPDVVVTFDGRKVSGASLTAKVADRPNILEMRASKAAELIRAHPQSTPYKGELPPLDIDFTTGQINQKGVLNRDLDTPNVGTTKLTRVYQLTDEEDEPKTRRKREAHHTPEHTLEQEMERNRTQTKNSSSDPRSPWFSRISVIVVSFYLMYL